MLQIYLIPTNIESLIKNSKMEVNSKNRKKTLKSLRFLLLISLNREKPKQQSKLKFKIDNAKNLVPKCSQYPS